MERGSPSKEPLIEVDWVRTAYDKVKMAKPGFRLYKAQKGDFVVRHHETIMSVIVPSRVAVRDKEIFRFSLRGG